MSIRTQHNIKRQAVKAAAAPMCQVQAANPAAVIAPVAIDNGQDPKPGMPIF
mgnify:CR=1 FL=1